MRFSAVVMAGLVITAGAAKAQQVQANNPQIPTQLQKNTVIPQARIEQQQKAMVILHSMEAAQNGSLCPGALQARQQSTGGAAIWTTALDEQSALALRPRGLGIHVDFRAAKTIKAIELRVNYLPLGLKRMEVAPASINTTPVQLQERSKRFIIDREAAVRIDANLLVGLAATVTRVDLVSVSFADGSVWHAPDNDACTVVPSRLMAVAAR